jgi:hypothetical protein
MVPFEVGPRQEGALIAELATGMWRLRRRLLAAGDQPDPTVLRIRRDVESLWDRLREGGVEVMDHAGALPGSAVVNQEIRERPREVRVRPPPGHCASDGSAPNSSAALVPTCPIVARCDGSARLQLAGERGSGYSKRVQTSARTIWSVVVR